MIDFKKITPELLLISINSFSFNEFDVPELDWYLKVDSDIILKVEAKDIDNIYTLTLIKSVGDEYGIIFNINGLLVLRYKFNVLFSMHLEEMFLLQERKNKILNIFTKI